MDQQHFNQIMDLPPYEKGQVVWFMQNGKPFHTK